MHIFNVLPLLGMQPPVATCGLQGSEREGQREEGRELGLSNGSWVRLDQVPSAPRVSDAARRENCPGKEEENLLVVGKTSRTLRGL